MNTTSDFSTLESKISTLLKSLDQLQSENHALRKKLAKMAQGHATLQEKNKLAAARIRRIIHHLKEEACS